MFNTQRALIPNTQNFPNIEEWKTILSPYKAILFDMDGTLLNTEPLHGKAIYSLWPSGLAFSDIEIEGLRFKNLDELHEYFKGQSDLEVCTALKKYLDVSPEDFVEKKNRHLIEKTTLKELKEAFPVELENFIFECRKLGLKLGLVSASQKPVIESFVDLLDIRHNFDFIIGREDTAQTKPHPDPYLLAFEKLALSPEDVCIFEDSKPGLESAHASKARVFQALWFS